MYQSDVNIIAVAHRPFDRTCLLSLLPLKSKTLQFLQATFSVLKLVVLAENLKRLRRDVVWRIVDAG